MSTGEILDVHEFTKIKCIGKGAYGEVHLVDFRGQKLALKEVSKELVMKVDRIQSVFNEKSALERADSPYLPTFEFSFQDQNSLYFVLEYIPHCLKDIIRKNNGLPLPKVIFYAAQLVQAL